MAIGVITVRICRDVGKERNHYCGEVKSLSIYNFRFMTDLLSDLLKMEIGSISGIIRTSRSRTGGKIRYLSFFLFLGIATYCRARSLPFMCKSEFLNDTK